MKTILIATSILLTVTSLYSQVDNVFLIKLKEKAEKEQDKLYQDNTSKIYLVISNSDAYKKLSEQINANVVNADQFNAIAKKINPSDRTLTGESYNDYLKRAAIKHFIDPADEAQNENRMKAIINNLTSPNVLPTGSIVGNLVRGFVNSNPVLSAASSILNGVSTFFKTKVKRGVVASVDETIKESKLKAFNDEIADYVAFYDRALEINIAFDAKLKSILVRSAIANDSVKYLVDQYQNKLKKKIQGTVTNVGQIQNAFPYDFKSHYFNEFDPLYYDLVSSSGKVLKLVAQSNKLGDETESLIKDYFDDFNALFKEFQGRIRNGNNSVNLTNILRTEVVSYASNYGTTTDNSFDFNKVALLENQEMEFNFKDISFIDTPFPFSIENIDLESPKIVITEEQGFNMNYFYGAFCIALIALNIFLLIKKRILN